ncbi:MAG: chromate transporter [Candidatus Cloacimonadaceae bacterium]|nr:chromate transporter [Candidatus Cloacimonadaceae bacterium]MDP3113797.1 chromate transporter [Candidatus Cloacimonadaceae bacterium]
MLWQIFKTFFKIGALTIGGAYAMIPLIRDEVCFKRRWISDDEFLDGLAAAQSCPGPLAVNLAVYLGIQIRGRNGMAMAVLGTLLPSTISIILIASVFTRYAHLDAIQRVFHALRPAVVALIAVPLIQMTKKAGINAGNFWFPLLSAALVAIFFISPVYLIALTILFAVLQSLRRQRRKA